MELLSIYLQEMSKNEYSTALNITLFLNKTRFLFGVWMTFDKLFLDFYSSVSMAQLLVLSYFCSVFEDWISEQRTKTCMVNLCL